MLGPSLLYRDTTNEISTCSKTFKANTKTIKTREIRWRECLGDVPAYHRTEFIGLIAFRTSAGGSFSRKCPYCQTDASNSLEDSRLSNLQHVWNLKYKSRLLSFQTTRNRSHLVAVHIEPFTCYIIGDSVLHSAKKKRGFTPVT